MNNIGTSVGSKLVDELGVDRFPTHMDAIRFVCADLWTFLYKKPIDHLQTNNKGTFLLKDLYFLPIVNLSSNTSSPDSGLYLEYPCGLIQGVLSSLGINSTVIAVPNIPECCFEIQMLDSGEKSPIPTRSKTQKLEPSEWSEEQANNNTDLL